MDPEFHRSIIGAKIRLRSRSAYFTVLLGHVKLAELSDDCPMPTACTDAKTIWINKKFWFSLTLGQREFLLAHEVLHAAMGHCWRCGTRGRMRWNYACDYVVNLILDGAGFELIKESLCSYEYSAMTVDEVYALLPDDDLALMFGGIGPDVVGKGAGDQDGGGEGRTTAWDDVEGRELENAWRAARAAARTAERMYGQGNTPLGSKIEVVVEDPSLRWEELIWRTINFDNSDFGNFDRRLLHDEVYVEDLECGEGLADVAICIDTSGSVLGILGKFVGAVKALASLYSKEIPVYWDDAALVGPIPLSQIDEPVGGGGTSFVPFFDEVGKRGYRHVVYLTDLCGTFPKDPPEAEVLWVVPAGVVDDPPFGRVAKILVD